MAKKLLVTNEQKRERKLEMTQKWRENNPDYIKNYNKLRREIRQARTEDEKAIDAVYSKLYWQNNKVKLIEQNKQLRASMSGRADSLSRAAKARAHAKNLEFSITKEDILLVLADGRCQVTGIPFEIITGRRSPWAPSIDRIDNSLGYTKENSRVVIWIYNQAKGEYTDTDLLRVAKALVSYP